MDSILIAVKKMLGIEQAYTQFDSDIIIYINSVMLSANQLGIGPTTGFIITGESETWVDFIGDRIDIIAIQNFIYLKVRLMFDPPSSGFVVDAIERQIKELEWRLNVQAENVTTV